MVEVGRVNEPPASIYKRLAETGQERQRERERERERGTGGGRRRNQETKYAGEMKSIYVNAIDNISIH